MALQLSCCRTASKRGGEGMMRWVVVEQLGESLLYGGDLVVLSTKNLRQ